MFWKNRRSNGIGWGTQGPRSSPAACIHDWQMKAWRFSQRNRSTPSSRVSKLVITITPRAGNSGLLQTQRTGASHKHQSANSVKRGQEIDASQPMQAKRFLCAHGPAQKRQAGAVQTQEVLLHKRSPGEDWHLTLRPFLGCELTLDR